MAHQNGYHIFELQASILSQFTKQKAHAITRFIEEENS
jgi:hypothetical protein